MVKIVQPLLCPRIKEALNRAIGVHIILGDEPALKLADFLQEALGSGIDLSCTGGVEHGFCWLAYGINNGKARTIYQRCAKFVWKKSAISAMLSGASSFPFFVTCTFM